MPCKKKILENSQEKTFRTENDVIDGYISHALHKFTKSWRWKAITATKGPFRSLIKAKVKNLFCLSLKLRNVPNIPFSITWKKILSRLRRIDCQSSHLHMNLQLFHHAKNLKFCRLKILFRYRRSPVITNNIFVQCYCTKNFRSLILDTMDHHISGNYDDKLINSLARKTQIKFLKLLPPLFFNFQKNNDKMILGLKKLVKLDSLSITSLNRFSENTHTSLEVSLQRLQNLQCVSLKFDDWERKSPGYLKIFNCLQKKENLKSIEYIISGSKIKEEIPVSDFVTVFVSISKPNLLNLHLHIDSLFISKVHLLLLLANIHNCHSLRSFEIKFSSIGTLKLDEEIFEKLGNFLISLSAIEDFSLKYSTIPFERSEKLYQILKKMRPLSSLSLDIECMAKNMVELESISEFLESQSHLKKLHFTLNQSYVGSNYWIVPNSWKIIMKGFEKLEKLEDLHINLGQAREFPVKSMKSAVGAMLAKMKNLKSLNLVLHLSMVYDSEVNQLIRALKKLSRLSSLFLGIDLTHLNKNTIDNFTNFVKQINYQEFGFNLVHYDKKYSDLTEALNQAITRVEAKI